MSQRFLSEKQVAEMLGLSVKTLQRWRLFGYGPKWRKFGTAVRYPSDGLESWVEETPTGGGGPTRANQENREVDAGGSNDPRQKASNSVKSR